MASCERCKFVGKIGREVFLINPVMIKSEAGKAPRLVFPKVRAAGEELCRRCLEGALS